LLIKGDGAQIWILLMEVADAARSHGSISGSSGC
jgi:hypothetical protein